MPVAAEIQTCAFCNAGLAPMQTSWMPGVCWNCFERRYTLCNDCGQVIGINEGGQCWRCRNQSSRQSYWRPRALDINHATYTEIGSTRKYGVEIETASCTNHIRLRGNTVFGAKCDCSVSGLEFDSPVLYGDEGLGIIREFLAFGARNRWTADQDCGCHTHYDMRDASERDMARITYAYRAGYELFESIVAPWRRDNEYAYRPDYNTRDIRQAYAEGDFQEWCCGMDRYHHINISAYGDHETFEVRILEGTVDAELICNWIKFNCRFMDWACQKDFGTFDRVFNADDGGIQVVGRATRMTRWLRNRQRDCANMPSW